jgi:hypothetical protein
MRATGFKHGADVVRDRPQSFVQGITQARQPCSQGTLTIYTPPFSENSTTTGTETDSFSWIRAKRSLGFSFSNSTCGSDRLG